MALPLTEDQCLEDTPISETSAHFVSGGFTRRRIACGRGWHRTSIISISVHDEEDKWRAFTAKNQMAWPQYLDRDGKVQRAFSVNRFPTYVLIAHEGIVRYRAGGMSFEREADLNDAIRKTHQNTRVYQPCGIIRNCVCSLLHDLICA